MLLLGRRQTLRLVVNGHGHNAALGAMYPQMHLIRVLGPEQVLAAVVHLESEDVRMLGVVDGHLGTCARQRERLQRLVLPIRNKN